MKSLVIQFFIGFALVSTLFSCNKNSDSNNNTQTTIGYAWNGYTCVQTSTGQQVPTSYCATNNSNSGDSIISLVCNGNYLLNGQVYQCGITSNCSGFLMTNYQTGQMVQCQ